MKPNTRVLAAKCVKVFERSANRGIVDHNAIKDGEFELVRLNLPRSHAPFRKYAWRTKDKLRGLSPEDGSLTSFRVGFRPMLDAATAFSWKGQSIRIHRWLECPRYLTI